MSEGGYALRGVSRTWLLDRVPVHALAEVDLVFRPGEAVAIMGASGSGKSTLLQLAALLDPPSSGGVWFEGRCLSGAGGAHAGLDDDGRSRFRLERLGFVHQAYPMVVALTPLQNVMLPAEYARARGTAGTPRTRALELLERVGMAALADRDVRTLSGGERQRVAIARALVNRPAVVFADEPTAALDAENGARVLDLLYAETRAAGATLVVATHDAAVAGRADRVVRLAAGRVQPAGPPAAGPPAAGPQGAGPGQPVDGDVTRGEA